MLYVEDGSVAARTGDLVVEAQAGGAIYIGIGDLVLEAGAHGATVIAFAGMPLAGPVAFGGPFIMNDQDGIEHAFDRFRSGGMGSLGPRDDADPDDRPPLDTVAPKEPEA